MSISHEDQIAQKHASRSLPPGFKREKLLIALLMTYIATGLTFMLFPGTFLGVWNLFAISSAHTASSISPEWVQAHGHAQLFGWIGTFILGIGFYSIPNLRRVTSWFFVEGWLIWALWTAGVTLRWFANVYLIEWTILLPASAVLEFAAALLFLRCSVKGQYEQLKSSRRLAPWAALVLAGTFGLLASVFANLVGCLQLSKEGSSPAFPPGFDAIYLIISIWGFPVPVAWGFTARWMPVFLGLKPSKNGLLFLSIAIMAAGLISASANLLAGSFFLTASALIYSLAVRIFEKADKPAKVKGVHGSFPAFVRLAYVWLLLSGLLAVWAALEPNSPGIGGAGRHALTVGFLMTLVFAVAPRMLPAFLCKTKLFSQTLMLVAPLLTNLGCLLRVSSEIIAYQDSTSWAWLLLPLSASLELSGVIVFSINMILTFAQESYTCPYECNPPAGKKVNPR